MTHIHDVTAPIVGWQRPQLMPEGEKDFLDDHPFDLVRTPLPAGVLVETVRIHTGGDHPSRLLLPVLPAASG